VARLKALLRRTGRQSAPMMRGGRFVLDDNARRITFDGKPIEVSPMEYRLVAFLAANAGRATPALELALHVQGRDDDAAKNAIEAMVTRLRRKTAPDAIENRRGFGYLLMDEAP